MTGDRDLEELVERIELPDDSLGMQAEERQAMLTKPAGALGRLEPLGEWLCRVQGVCPPRPLDRVTVVVFAADHAIATSARTSAYPPEVTAQMVRNLLAGGAALNVFAAMHGVDVRIVDIGVSGPPDQFPPTVSANRVTGPLGSLDREDVLDYDDALDAFWAGVDIADELVDSGVDLLIPGDMGIGNTTPAAALIGLLTSTDIVDVVGRGTGIDDATWMRKAAAVRDGMRRGRGRMGDPIELVGAVGGPDFAAMAGFLLGATARRTPVLLDGVVSLAAALIADRLCYRARQWWLAGHRSTEPAASRAMKRLRLEPLLDLDLRLGEGTGAVLALPLVRAAGAALAEMATFESAGVSARAQP